MIELIFMLALCAAAYGLYRVFKSRDDGYDMSENPVPPTMTPIEDEEDADGTLR